MRTARGGSRIIIIIIIIGIVMRTCAGVGSASIACLAARSFHRPPSLVQLLRMMGGAEPPTPPSTSSSWLETFHVAFVH
ncbi:hypothetical protein BGW80DRAFT_1357433, partial [Lactifluus volemus]